MRRIMLCGTNSGCGKTTVAAAILQALLNRGVRAASFKCGPDYIDPMFHSRIIGAQSYNLDRFFCDDDTLKFLFEKHSREADISVIEGVMGFYDGGQASSHELSQALNVPAVIVVDCKGMGTSVGAVIKGFLSYKATNNIAGFIFNRLSERLLPETRKICEELHTEFLGYIPYCKNAEIQSRHLGLLTADEISDLQTKAQILAEAAEKYVCLDRLIELSNAGHLGGFKAPVLTRIGITKKKPVVIAAAADAAFCFTYRDNMELLEELGCEIRYFSPLSDKKLPENSRGIILCGGYPELYAEQLSENTAMLSEIRERILGGMPTIAECGGFMYLHETLENADGKQFSAVGVIKGRAFKTEKLQRFGYVNLTAKRDNLLCKAGEKIPAHEFHYCESSDAGEDFSAEKTNGEVYSCIHAGENIYAGFPHLYFYANPPIAENFVKKCMEYTG
ncbi:MAG: cobyrinate a,c-diamide synthase [Oscillospiraceae bacterium]|nr:cobyrinate a,c-diamide synthase [Oscillospiraceae bacterium]